jgi:hypothetical protein
MKSISCFLFLTGCLLSQLSFSQDYKLKQAVAPDEVRYLQEMMKEISQTDQQYRKYLGSNTLDDALIASMDSVYEADGIESYTAYCKSLDLKLDSTVEDSLWQLQHELDFQNHLLLRGIFLTYGFLPKDLLGEYHYVPLLLLMHPPKDWDVPHYLTEYAELFQAEIQAGRMPAKTFATFYDNMKAKILREPQLYGTNQQWDPATQAVLPPIISDLQLTNEARTKIGLPPLQAGEYRLSK